MGRFKSLVDSEEGIESFRALYRIPPGVGFRYCREGQWHEDKQEGKVVILMIAFIEGGMKIPMGRIIKDYLRDHRLALTQCAPNKFRILEGVDALNEKMDLRLTHHDVNWVYNLHHLKGRDTTWNQGTPRSGLSSASLNPTRGWINIFWSCQGSGTMASPAWRERDNQVGL